MATYKGHNEDSSGNILLSIGNGMTATVETGSTASQAYTKGAYLFFNNRFCKATAAISSGATLAIGTNLSETSVGAEITSHLRSSDGKEFYFDVKDGTYGYYPSASKTASEFVPFGGTAGYVPVRIESWTHTSASPGYSAGPYTENVAVDDLILVEKTHVYPTIHSDDGGAFEDISAEYGFDDTYHKVYRCTIATTKFHFTYSASYSSGAWCHLKKQ